MSLLGTFYFYVVDIYRRFKILLYMSFWAITSLILSITTVSSVAILFIFKRLSKKRSIYIFRTEEGEEIPLGI
jgi:hypothetical protein